MRLFGGVAKFRGALSFRRRRFRIAVAGPLVSLAIGGLLRARRRGLPLPPALDRAAAWLGYINLVLLVFNLLPALPLDGGRTPARSSGRSAAASRWATRVAAGLGRALGSLLIVGGLVMALDQGAFGGIWLAFVGWFLLQAEAAEGRFRPPAVRWRASGSPT